MRLFEDAWQQPKRLTLPASCAYLLPSADGKPMLVQYNTRARLFHRNFTQKPDSTLIAMSLCLSQLLPSTPNPMQFRRHRIPCRRD